MKLSFIRDQLLEPLHCVMGAVERKQTLQILSCVLLEAEAGALTVTATNMEMQLLATASDVKAKDFALCVNARKLYDILRALPDNASVTFESREERLNISSGKSRFHVATLSANQFPAFTAAGAHSEAVSFTVDISSFREALAKASSAQATDDVRYFLNGVCIRIKGDELRAIASDGHRLAWHQTWLSTPLPTPKEFILPRRSVAELLKLLNADKDPKERTVKCWLHPNTLTTEMPNLSFSTKLIEGRFPDENRVMPRNAVLDFTVDRAQLTELLIRVAILAPDKSPLIRLTLDSGRLSVTAANAEAERAEDELPIECSGDCDIGFNSDYLLDGLQQIDTELARIRIDDRQSVLLSEPDHDQYGVLVMPAMLTGR